MECKPGLYQDREGSTACKPCEAGTVPDSNRTVCKRCEEAEGVQTWTFGDDGKCKSCEGGQDSERNVPIVQFSLNTSSCECIAGYRRITPVEDLRRPVCGPCSAPNTIKTSKEDCKACGPGTRPSKDRTICYPCEQGTWTFVQGGLCKRCEGGKFQTRPDGEPECECDAGQYRTGGSNIKPDCKECKDGEFFDAKSKACNSCPPGTKSNNEKTDCEPCHRGWREQDNKCLECQVGFYAFSPGQRLPECHSCPAGADCELDQVLQKKDWWQGVSCAGVNFSQPGASETRHACLRFDKCDLADICNINASFKVVDGSDVQV